MFKYKIENVSLFLYLPGMLIPSHYKRTSVTKLLKISLATLKAEKFLTEGRDRSPFAASSA